jgi:PAS domain S-box-containing protein
MQRLVEADAVLATTLEHLRALRADSSADLNRLQVIKAQLQTARAVLNETRQRIARLEDENRQLNSTPEVAAAAALNRFSAVFQYALDAILIANDDARYIEANPAACILLEYSRSELLALGVGDITPPAHREAFKQAWPSFMAQGTMSGEYSVQTKSGTLVQVEFRAVANVLPGEHLSILRDVTKIRAAQTSAQEQAEHGRRALKASLYEALDVLTAAKIDLTPPRWRAVFAGDNTRRLGAELDGVIESVRRSIVSLET